MTDPRTIPELLRHWALERPAAVYQRLLFPDRDAVAISFAAMERRTRAWAALWQARGVGRGDVVLVLLPHHEDLVACYYGAIWIGAIPSYLPSPASRHHVERTYADLRALIERTGPRAILAEPAVRDELLRRFAQTSLRPAPGLLVPADLDPRADAGDPAPADPEDVALLQYSSGSTGLQKGAALSHRAILAECAGVGGFFAMTERDSFFSWIPLYHDWGLVCLAIHPLVLGTSFTHLSPLHWVARPAAALDAVTRWKPTIYWEPNFAFHFMANRIRDEEMEGRDLSSIRLHGNGAEPCFFESHEAFTRRFAPLGFRHEAHGIVYGMAEVVNSVIGAGHKDPIHTDTIDRRIFQEEQRAVPVPGDHPEAQRMLGTGRAFEGSAFRVVDDAFRDRPERAVGEILIRSRCAFHGYWKNPEATRAARHGDWYVTGDLGYVADGRLYVTGRKKDLLILAGQNVYPQDVEAMVAEHPAVVKGRVAALGIQDPSIGTQRLVIVAETKSHDPAVHADIARFARREVSQRLQVSVDRVLVAPHRWLHKTSSGKIARAPTIARLHELG